MFIYLIKKIHILIRRIRAYTLSLQTSLQVHSAVSNVSCYYVIGLCMYHCFTACQLSEVQWYLPAAYTMNGFIYICMYTLSLVQGFWLHEEAEQ